MNAISHAYLDFSPGLDPSRTFKRPSVHHLASFPALKKTMNTIFPEGLITSICFPGHLIFRALPCLISCREESNDHNFLTRTSHLNDLSRIIYSLTRPKLVSLGSCFSLGIADPGDKLARRVKLYIGPCPQIQYRQDFSPYILVLTFPPPLTFPGFKKIVTTIFLPGLLTLTTFSVEFSV